MLDERSLVKPAISQRVTLYELADPLHFLDCRFGSLLRLVCVVQVFSFVPHGETTDVLASLLPEYLSFGCFFFVGQIISVHRS
jgi:hypothetical protein